jgi:hypothetical protein
MPLKAFVSGRGRSGTIRKGKIEPIIRFDPEMKMEREGGHMTASGMI